MRQERLTSFIKCSLMLVAPPQAICTDMQRPCTERTTCKAAPLKRYLYTSLRFFLGMSMAAFLGRSRR